jgi:cellulose synthase/poly-beta-1,6-N-acetylglucosamine synthase-like glycosyltransferase
MSWILTGYIIICSILLLYYFLVFSRLYFFKPKQYAPEILPKVSVIICAKNEEENLRQNLKVVLIQKYPSFEVIVVNDQSTDKTAEVVQYYCDRNENLRLINIKADVTKPLPGKKFPLQVGVKAATNEIIVVTDADCKPANTLWLKNLVAEFLKETDFVLGYAPFNKENSFINKVIRYDNVMTAMQYLSYAAAGIPYMGVGRNMAFRKSMFLTWEEKEKTKKILSGDDDLFINAKAKGASTEIAINKNSFIYSAPKETYQEWLNQKTRHLQTGYHYKFIHLFLLNLFALTNVLYYAWPLLALFEFEVSPYLLPLFTTVLFLKFVFHARIASKLNNTDLIPYLIVLDIIFAINLPILFIKSLFSRTNEWK